MPSLFSRKKSTARASARPASGVPENFGHRGGGMEQLRRTDSPEAMPAARPQQPPPQQPQAQHFAQKDLPYVPGGPVRTAASTTQADRYGPGPQVRNGAHLQTTSLPDARQQPYPQQQSPQQQLSPQQQYPRPSDASSDAAQARPASRGSSSSFWSKRELHGSTAFPRRGFSAALHDQVLYWFGGKSDRGLNNELDTLDTATWEVRRVKASGSLPEPREGHTATFIGRTMFVFGGELESRACDDSLYAYNMANCTWYKVPMQGAALMGRKGHTTAQVGSKMIVFGGTADGQFLNDLVSFDVRAATKQGPRWNFDNLGTANAPGNRNSQASLRREDLVQPPARAGHSCSVYPGSIYVFGGMNGEQCFNDLWVHDLELRRWKEVRPHGATPPARYGHASAVVDDCIFIMGGRTLRGEPLNDFFAYKITSQRWYTFQVNSAAWPHQIDPMFSLVKTRLLLYSGTMSRDDQADQVVYSLDTSKIKIQPDAPRAAAAAMPPPPVSPVSQTSDEKSRRHHSLMPPAMTRTESPQQPHPQSAQAVRAVSMVGDHDARAPLAVDTARANGSASIDSFEIINSMSQDDEARAANGAWSPQTAKGRGHPRRSIALGSVGSPPVGPMPDNAVGYNVPVPNGVAAPAEGPGSAESSLDSLGGEPDDRRLTIQLRNRSSVAAPTQAGMVRAASESPSLPPVNHTADPVRPATQPNGTAQARTPDSEPHISNIPPSPRIDLPELPGARRISAQLSISSEAKDAVSRAWGAVEAKYSTQRTLTDEDASASMASVSGEALLSGEATRVLDVLLAMRRELAETKQQLSTVSRVAMERVTEAERGRKAALQEAIYLKAKASALAGANPQLLSKLGSHRIHELERLHANTLNDNDALRNQLATANQALKQSHDALAEYRSDAEMTRRQLRELEQLYSDAQRAHEEDRERLEAAAHEHGAESEALAEMEQQLADAEAQLADKDRALEALAAADADRAERLDTALRSASSANERAERVQLMLEESLQRADALDARASELAATSERQRADVQRAQERASRFEQLWTDAKEEMAAFGGLRRAVEQLESKDRHIATLQRKLSDVHSVPKPRKDSSSSALGSQPFPRVSISSDVAPAEQRVRDFHAAYLAAHRQWSETRDELLSLKSVLRDSDDQRRDADARLAQRERELGEMQARLAAFTSLLQEYADAQRSSRLKGLARADDEISVASMLAAIQQLQRTSSFAGTPPHTDIAQGPAHIL
ncbi:hypothetical protein GGH12_004115 [Coemansia sp. RSA 1822]|nr:hypothetical protein LPJ76_003859 [Coemansia sp. RSA 638]KAJ2125746.1 hypothetical protein IW147_000517 [Coemansia sp. RSA 720]KAJ2541216.1 hypothetical protein GGF49_003851 [Coemansia sp. RSA 1853]KAJ2561294.1 hypothetical protein GGH12_004115 [Coemansia sp. RSA 1822]